MFRSLMTIIGELYLYLTEVIFMFKHSVKLRVHNTQHTCRSTVSLCTAHNTLAALRHAATSPSIHNDVILPSVLT